MKRIIFTLFLLFWASLAFGTTYYVGQSGTGVGDGSSTSDLMSISNHNSTTFSPGDKIYFCGTISNTVTISSNGTSENYIEYSVDCPSNPGVISTSDDYAISMSNVNYIKFEDFNATSEQDIIKIGGGCSYVTFDGVVIHDCYKRGFYITDDTSGSNRNDHITITNCKAYDIGCGTAGGDVVLAYTDNFQIAHSELYATKSDGLASDRGIDGVVMEHATEGVIEYNLIHDHNDDYSDDPLGESDAAREGKGEDGIDIKYSSNNIIVRYNHIYNHQKQSGITVQRDSYNLRIYGNYIHDNWWAGILLNDGVSDGSTTHNVYIYGNILEKNSQRGISFNSSNDGVSTVNIYNNMLAENSANATVSQHCAIYTGLNDNISIINNVFYNNYTKYGTHHAIYTITGISGLEIYNNDFYDGSTAKINVSGTLVDINSQSNFQNNIDTDPQLKSLRSTSTAYSWFLDKTSPCYNTGTSGGYSFALSTAYQDWDTPDPVTTTRSHWDIGPWSIDSNAVDKTKIGGGISIIMEDFAL